MTDAYKVAYTLPISAELLADASPGLQSTIAVRLYEGLDRAVNPWRYPDSNPMPTFVLFPTVERIIGWWQERTARHTPSWDD